MRGRPKVTLRPILLVTSRTCKVEVRRLKVPVKPCRVNLENINVSNVASSSRERLMDVMSHERWDSSWRTRRRKGEAYQKLNLRGKGGSAGLRLRQGNRVTKQDRLIPASLQVKDREILCTKRLPAAGRKLRAGKVDCRRQNHEDDIFEGCIALNKNSHHLLLDYSTSTDSSTTTTPEKKQQDNFTPYWLNQSRLLHGPPSPRSSRPGSSIVCELIRHQQSSYIRQRLMVARRKLDLGPSISEQGEGGSEGLVEKAGVGVRVGTELRELVKSLRPVLMDPSFNNSPD